MPEHWGVGCGVFSVGDALFDTLSIADEALSIYARGFGGEHPRTERVDAVHQGVA